MEKEYKSKIVLDAIIKVSLKYYETTPVTEKENIKWITKNAPRGYNKTISFAPIKLKIESNDSMYNITYNDLVSKINERSELYLKSQQQQRKRKYKGQQQQEQEQE